MSKLYDSDMGSIPPPVCPAPRTADVLIIGGGPAGLSAALTLYRQLHTVMIFDSQQPRNKWATPTHATSTWEGRSATSMREAAEQELTATGLVHFEHVAIQSISKESDTHFVLTDSTGETWHGRKLLLAMGKEHVFPAIPGYEENFATGIFHCMFTFGYEQRGKKSAGLIATDALALPRHTAMVINDTAKFVDNVTVYTDGKLDDITGMQEAVSTTGATINNAKIVAIRQGSVDSAQMVLELDSGQITIEDFLVHQPRTVVSPWVLKQLPGLELDERGDIIVKWPFYQSSVSGVFAAGDCASPFKIIPNSLLMGANAGAGIARELPKSVTRQPLL